MRIAYISDQSAPHYIGGYETRLWLLAKRMAARGHDVHIFTSCPKNETIDGVRFHRVLPKINYFPKTGFRSLKRNALFALALLRFCSPLHRFDVVDANSIPWIHLPSAFVFAKFAKSRYVISVHEAFSKAMPTYFEAKQALLSRLTAFLAIRFYRWSQGLADVLVATSPSCIEGVRAEGFKTKPIVLVNSGEDPQPESDIDFLEKGLRVVFTGRLVQMKRLGVLLEALKKAGDPECTIIGDGPLLESLTERSSELDLHNTKLRGRVSDEQKRTALLRSTVFVMPSYREGWSLSTLEGMAHGCVPIYGYRPERYDTGITTYTTDGVDALQFDGSADSLAEKLIRLSRDPDELRALREAAWRRTHDFAWSATLARAEAAYAKPDSPGTRSLS